MKKKLNILLTGGSGFVGKAFLKKYRGEFHIVAPTKAQMDLLDARSVEEMFSKNKFDAVVHLANSNESHTRTAIQVDNLIMFKNIQYMSIVHGVKKLIILGAGAETDRSRPVVDISEEQIGEYVPNDGYGLGRYLIHVLASKDKITTNLRAFGVYGAGGSGPISKIVAAGARGKKHIVIDRNRVVSAVYVDDAVKVIAEFLKKDLPKGDYNLVSGDKASYLDVAKAIRRLSRHDGNDVDIVVKDKDEPDNEFTATNAKLLAVLPKMRFVHIPSGVKNSYEDCKNNGNNKQRAAKKVD